MASKQLAVQSIQLPVILMGLSETLIWCIAIESVGVALHTVPVEGVFFPCPAIELNQSMSHEPPGLSPGRAVFSGRVPPLRLEATKKN